MRNGNEKCAKRERRIARRPSELRADVTDDLSSREMRQCCVRAIGNINRDDTQRGRPVHRVCAREHRRARYQSRRSRRIKKRTLYQDSRRTCTFIEDARATPRTPSNDCATTATFLPTKASRDIVVCAISFTFESRFVFHVRTHILHLSRACKRPHGFIIGLSSRARARGPTYRTNENSREKRSIEIRGESKIERLVDEYSSPAVSKSP